MIEELELAGTEASAFVSFFVAFSFATSGAWIPAVIAGAIGAALLVAYHFLEVRFIELDEDEVREYVGTVEEQIDDVTESDDE